MVDNDHEQRCPNCWTYAQELATDNIRERGEEVTTVERDAEALSYIAFGDIECTHTHS